MSEPMIRNGDTEPIQAEVRNQSGEPLTGLTDIFVRVRRDSDGQFFDWSDSTFKAAGHVAIAQLLSEVDATNAPGLYEVTGGFDTSTVVNVVLNDRYVVFPFQTPGTDALLPSPGAFRVGQWVQDIVLTRKRNLNRRRLNFTANPTVEEVYDDDGSGPILTAVVSDSGGNNVVAALGAPSEVQKFT